MRSKHLSSISLFFYCLFFTVSTWAQHLVPEKKSLVEFQIYNHKNGNNIIKGLFPTIKGDIFFDPKQLSKSSFDITVNTADVSVSDPKIVTDLKTALFLAAAKYPVIHIKSSSITADGSVIYILHGTLTLKGVTKPVTIQFTATPTKTGYLFRGTFQINRLQYNIGEKGDLDDMVTLFIELRAGKV